jgi:hypothetical protein
VEPSVAGLASEGAPLSDGAAPSIDPELDPLDPPELELLEPPELEPPPPNSPPSPPSRPPRPPSPDDSPPPLLDELPDAALPPEQVLLWHVPPVAVQSAHAALAAPQALSAVPGWQAPVESQQPDAHGAAHADIVPLSVRAALLLVSALASLPESSPLLAKSFTGPDPQAVPRAIASPARE